MRRLPLFGNSDCRVDFKYPTKYDLKAFPKDTPIKATGLNWKKQDDNIVGIQLIFSNGMKSPLFLGRNQNDDDLLSIEINSKVNRIRGT